jgi:predicted O-methyltransferase YrrM
MKPVEIQKIVLDTPHMSPDQANLITDHIHRYKARDILELGFAHGVSTCYIAAALQEAGGGKVTAIDLEAAHQRKPSIDSLVKQCGLQDYVETYFEPTSYTWRLMKFIEQDPTPRFDLCYLDGAHNWFVDGFAFFLVDKLLRLNGWIIFDDLDWTYAASPALHDTDWVKSMSPDERETPQVRKVYELLVKPHPAYDDFHIHGDWVFARKIRDLSAGSGHPKKETMFMGNPTPQTSILSRLKRRIMP